jgi:biotin-(acetyl-CoA carboxylase) ligase
MKMKKVLATAVLGAFILTGTTAVFAEPIKNIKTAPIYKQIQSTNFNKWELRDIIDYLVNVHNEKYPTSKIKIVDAEQAICQVKTIGTITKVEKNNNTVKVTIEGKGYNGGYDVIALNLEKNSKVTSVDGNKTDANYLKVGMQVVGYYQNKVTKTIPPTGTANHIIVQKLPADVQVKMVKTVGNIIKVNYNDDQATITVDGYGINGGLDKVTLIADRNSAMYDNRGNRLNARDLRAGYSVTAEYSNKLTKSYPAMGWASKIIVKTPEVLPMPGKKDPMTSGYVTDVIELQNNRKQILVTGQGVNSGLSEISLTVSNNTKIVNKNNKAMSLKDIQKGIKVDAYYGKVMTKSIPAQANVTKIVIL